MRLDHVQLAIPAGAEDLCRPFYAGILGLEEMAKPDALAGRGGGWFRGAGMELHLGVDTDFRPAKKAHPGLVTDELEALAERLGAAGYPVRWDAAIEGRRRFFTEDPVGNRIEIIGG
ncbi:VOC family protein [Acidimangrovimonas sediminis]|uniref:glyoxalase n=1 Tax=Acidimangrovimonas sediminis TaxID=2056283 RepID=UPI001E5D84FB|nr:glyoxalase [Acidimangrovimonas sediminis]